MSKVFTQSVSHPKRFLIRVYLCSSVVNHLEPPFLVQCIGNRYILDFNILFAFQIDPMVADDGLE